MTTEMYVKKSYSFVDEKNRIFGEGRLVNVDLEDPYIKKQLWKLEAHEVIVEPTPIPKIVLGDRPLPNPDDVAVASLGAKDLIEELGFLAENEPPKVIVDENKKKPGTGIEKDKAESMLSRVKDFVEKQKEEPKK